MGKGGGGSQQPTQQNVTQTNLPEYAKPYFMNLMNRAQAASYTPYRAYGQERIAGFTPDQLGTQSELLGMGTPEQFGQATDLMGRAAQRSMQAGQYTPTQFNTQQVFAPELQQFQMAGVGDVRSSRINAPKLTQYQMGDVEDVRGSQIKASMIDAARMAGPAQFGRAQAKQYMSPYMQSVVDVQKRKALEDAQQTQLAAGLGAGQGTRGGARQLLATTQREKALGLQMGDIQSKGLQSAYEQAQMQFERDRAAKMQVGMANLNAEQQARVQNAAAQLQARGMTADQALRAALANQQAGLTVGQQNLAARLGVQQLGSQQQLQAQTTTADQALRAALANQQAGLTTGQQNLAAQLGVQQLGSQQQMQGALANQQQFLEAQRMAEQSRQYGKTLGLQGLAQSMQGAQMLGQLGTAEQDAIMRRLQAQGAVGAERRSLQQQKLDQRYADFLRQRDYPMEMLGYYSNILRGVPVQLGSTATTYAQPPSLASQAAGLGLAGLGMYNLGRG
jgi:hypothetical protein